ncbi:NYN domain protein [Corynebacterium choanae]|uniref:NYN domain protein n=1 Tax=Corynebacterium choanae TaxID=1862358 RepID=A0A3G6J363_9CORY|nr:NYN domain protein [Corynebacterium choanae]
MLERTQVYVDTSYLLASFYNSWETGARAQLEIDLPEVVNVLGGMIQQQLGQPIQRQLWYDGIPDSGPHRYQRALRTCDGVQLRTGQLIEWGDRRTQKAVDTRLVADMVLAGVRGQCSDIVLVSGDADMLPGVIEASACGVRVHLYGFGWDSMSSALRHACDSTTILDPREDFAECMRIQVLEGPIQPVVRTRPGDADATDPTTAVTADGASADGEAGTTTAAVDPADGHHVASSGEQTASEPDAVDANDAGDAGVLPGESLTDPAAGSAALSDGAASGSDTTTPSATPSPVDTTAPASAAEAASSDQSPQITTDLGADPSAAPSDDDSAGGDLPHAGTGVADSDAPAASTAADNTQTASNPVHPPAESSTANAATAATSTTPPARKKHADDEIDWSAIIDDHTQLTAENAATSDDDDDADELGSGRQGSDGATLAASDTAYPAPPAMPAAPAVPQQQPPAAAATPADVPASSTPTPGAHPAPATPSDSAAGSATPTPGSIPTPAMVAAHSHPPIAYSSVTPTGAQPSAATETSQDNTTAPSSTPTPATVAAAAQNPKPDTATSPPQDTDSGQDTTPPPAPTAAENTSSKPSVPLPSMMARRRRTTRHYIPLADEVWANSGQQNADDVGQQYAIAWYHHVATAEQLDIAHTLSGGPLPNEIDAPLLQFGCDRLGQHTLTEKQRVDLRDGFHRGIRAVFLNQANRRR